MSRKSIASVIAKNVQSEAAMSAHIHNLFTFSKIYIERARELAKLGDKDTARDWYRFFTNSNVLTLLNGQPVRGDVPQLRDELAFLGLECHPLNVPDFTNDLTSIRNCLQEILTHVQTNNTSSCKSDDGSNPRGSLDLHHGIASNRISEAETARQASGQ